MRKFYNLSRKFYSERRALPYDFVSAHHVVCKRPRSLAKTRGARTAPRHASNEEKYPGINLNALCAIESRYASDHAHAIRAARTKKPE